MILDMNGDRASEPERNIIEEKFLHFMGEIFGGQEIQKGKFDALHMAFVAGAYGAFQRTLEIGENPVRMSRVALTRELEDAIKTEMGKFTAAEEGEE